LAGRHWTPEENAKAMNAVRAGAKFEQIAAEHGRTAGAIRARAVLNATNAARESTGGLPGIAEIAAAAAEFHVDVSEVQRRLTKRNKTD
jgi:hypothetical protein